MRTTLRLTLGVALAAALALGTAAGAAADSLGGANAIVFDVTCDGAPLLLVSPSEASAIVQVAGGGVVVVSEVSTPLGASTYGPGHGKANGLTGALETVTCTGTIATPDGVFPIVLAVTGFGAPRGG
jgi:hypothetical protein